MNASKKRTFHLDDEGTTFVDAAVASGRFEDADAVVKAGLRALRDQDEVLERWLRDDVVPVAAAMMADPSRAIPMEEVFDDIERCHAARAATGPRGA